MKKTLIALMALGGVAMAGAEISYLTLDNAYTVVDSDGSLVSSVETALSGSTTYLNLNKLAHGNIGPSATPAAARSSISQTLTLENMLITPLLPVPKLAVSSPSPLRREWTSPV